MKYIYKSCLSESIEDFVQMMKQLGFKYATGISVMRLLDQSAFKFKLNSNGITKRFADEFCKIRPSETLQYRYYRMVCFRKFSNFLLDLGFVSYLPELPPNPGPGPFTPYIYTDDEITAILKACDRLCAQYERQAISPIFAIPILFRVLVGTGIRIGEALKLRINNINFEENTILIKGSKNQRERLLPITDSLKLALLDHKKSMDLFCSRKTKSPFFFVNIGGTTVTRSSLSKYFREMLSEAKLTYIGRSKGPRIHDFRHTFAVNAMKKMELEGVDLFTALPILSAYLGHQGIKATEHYLHLTEEAFPSIIHDVEIHTAGIYPKIFK